MLEKVLIFNFYIYFQDACVNLQRYRQLKKKKLKPGNKTNQNDLIDITKSDHSLRSNDQFSLGSKNVNNLVSDA